MIGIIYETIKTLCEEKGLTIKALEEKAGVANGVVGKWRKNTPQVDTAQKIADVLGVTIDELVNGHD